MFKCSGIGVFLGALLSFMLLQAAPSSNGLDQHLNKVHKEAAHPWINQLTVDPELEQPKDGVDGDVWYLLADFQTHAEKQQNYYHNAYRFLNPEGVGEDSQLTLNFHPSYQDLYLHKIVVHRQGKAQNRLPDCEIKLLNHESGIERQLYNGSISAHLILKDIQVGDVLEYAYSIQGRNPVFKDRFAQYINLSYATHVHRIHRRFLWNPQKRTLRHKIFCSDKDYQTTIGDDEAELLIDEIDAPIVTYEDGVPVWHFARPFIQVSDYESWEQFSHWAHSCFELDQELPDELGDVLKDLKAIENPSEQIVSALNYVQEQYRYLGSFMGSHTHRAYPLNLICERKFGDCKDKSLLLTYLLRALGYEAHVALVDSDDRQFIDNYLPSHFNFDHAITHLHLDGKDYWLDGTSNYQRGPLQQLYTRDYGFAFIIKEGANSLTPTQQGDQFPGLSHIKDRFIDKGFDQPAEYHVKSTYQGKTARSIRSYFASKSKKGIIKDYVEWYAPRYAKITNQSLDHSDDEKKNQIVVKESYEIPGFWKKDEEDNEIKASIHAKAISSELSYPDSPLRKMPYAVNHPRHVKQSIEVQLHCDWDCKEVSTDIDNDYFTFKRYSELTDDSITIHYEYKTKAKQVPPNEIEKFIEDCEAVSNALYYQFYDELDDSDDLAEEIYEGGTNSAPYAWKSAFSVGSGLFFSVGILGCFLLYFFYHPQPSPIEQPGLYVGIGGWLVLVMIRLFLMPMVSLGLIVEFAEFYTGDVIKDEITAGNGAYIFAIFFALISEFVLLPFNILLIILFIQKRASFPPLFVAFNILIVLSEGIFTLLAQNSGAYETSEISDLWGNTASALFAACIWAAYVKKSVRVRNTFREVKSKTKAGPPPLPTSTL